jgi:hypothetical protein
VRRQSGCWRHYVKRILIGNVFRRIPLSLFKQLSTHNPERAKASLRDFQEDLGMQLTGAPFAFVKANKSSALTDS